MRGKSTDHREYRPLQMPVALRFDDAQADGDDGKLPTIVGKAAVVDQLTTITARFRDKIVRFVEKFAPGAFRNALAENQDVVALVNHDDNLVLGRTASGTLRLAEDDNGNLEVEIDPPNTGYARDLVESIRRGDVRGMSVGFVARSGGSSWNDERTQRTLSDVDLFDVSPVTRPAYRGTSVAIRGESIADELESLAEAVAVDHQAEARKRRERLESLVKRLS